MSFAQHVDAVRQRHFPMQLPEGCVARHADRETVMAMAQKMFSEIFCERASPFALPDERKAGVERLCEQYGGLHHENILFFDPNGEVIGWFVGESEDHDTFYLRNSGVLPAWRRKGGATEFLRGFLAYLKDLGYERVSSQHQPTNRAVLIAELKLGFSIAGMELTEKWGPLIKLVLPLHDDRNRHFHEKFGSLGHLGIGQLK